MKTFICMKKQFRLFCIVFLMLGLLGIPMYVHAADTVLVHKIYHKHVAGCVGTLYKTMEAEVKDGPHITYDSTCSSCGGYVHHYDYSAECSCGLTWYDTGKACVNSPYGSNRGTCSNYEEVRLYTSHEHPYEEYVCGMTEETVIETIRVQYSTLQPATEVVLTATTDGNLGNVKLAWGGAGDSSAVTVTQNGLYKLYATYSDGGVQYVTELETSVNNIDKTVPTVSEIKADKTSPTNGKVVLSVEAKDSVGLPSNYASWNNGAYGSSNKYEVSANGTYTVTIKDLAGNTVTKSIKVSNIDKTAPTVSEIKADKTSPTNGKVVLSVEAKDSVGLPSNYASWNNGAYGSSNKYEVSANGTYTVTVKDLAGNTVTKSIKVSNIDKTAPTVSEIKADKTSPTNGKVVLSVEAKDSVGLPANYASWNNGAYGSSNKYEVSANGTYTVTVKDLAGNTATKSIKVSNIDLEVPNVSEIRADKTEFTNGKVLLTVEATDNVGLPEYYASWNNEEFGISNLYEASENGIYQVTVRDLAGNTTTKSIEISNIDREIPVVGEIIADKTDATNDKVILSIEVKDNEELPENYISWNGEEPGSSSNYEVTENGTYQVIVKDAAGNSVIKTIEISNIDKAAPEIVSVITNPEPWHHGNCMITIEAKDYGDDGEGSGLAKEAYSWDGGKTWVPENCLEVTKTGTIPVAVRDNAGNITETEVNVTKIKPAQKPENSEEEPSKPEQTSDVTLPVVTMPTNQIPTNSNPIEDSEEIKEEENGWADFVVPEPETEETVIEIEPFYEEYDAVELDTLENNRDGFRKTAVILVVVAAVTGLFILLAFMFILFGMCRVYEISAAGKEHYLGRTGIRHHKKNFVIKIGTQITDKATERILLIRIPVWFVKINENRPLRIVAGELVIAKYVEREVQFHIQV